MKIEYYGTVRHGRLSITGRKRMEQELQSFPDCDVSVTIRKRGKRSNNQNRYYHGIVVSEIRRAFRDRGTIMDAETVHEFLKLHFNKQYVHDENGEVIAEYGGKTSTLTKSEFSEYVDRIVEWAAEKLSLAIPPPGEQQSFFDLAA